jgi:hypothetical protein
MVMLVFYFDYFFYAFVIAFVLSPLCYCLRDYMCVYSEIDTDVHETPPSAQHFYLLTVRGSLWSVNAYMSWLLYIIQIVLVEEVCI